MHVFEDLIAAGARVAAMSGCTDGDCGWGGVESGERRRFLERAGAIPDALIALRQVHGTRIINADEGTLYHSAGLSPDTAVAGDGIITGKPGIPIAVAAADCVPVLLFDPVKRVVAALHAGRVGTTAAIARIGLVEMVSAFGVDPANVLARIGPSAGPCCYEVSEEMAAECASRGVIVSGRKLDLWRTNARYLEGAGVKGAHIAISGCCTICTRGFHSYRRTGGAARNLAVIML